MTHAFLTTQQSCDRCLEESRRDVSSNMASPLKERIVYEVRQVFLYIPSELSATGFELKIAGVVKVVKKVRHVNIIKCEEDTCT